MKRVSLNPAWIIGLALLFAAGAVLVPGPASAKVYNHKGPDFKLEFPDGYQDVPLKKDEVLSKKNPAGVPLFQVSVIEMQDAGGMQAFASGYARILQSMGTDVKVISNQKTETLDGTEAWESVIEWKLQGKTPLVSLVFAAFKDGKVVFIGVHTMGDLDPARAITESLEFQ
ncbi:MAG: hypothetical protein KKB20_04800 [Proteobacteria bacterium]|nr:hypothetical protein [Pseudomonadota bacterium]